MKRLQIYIEADIDRALAIEATKRATSKAELIREAVREQYGAPLPPGRGLDELVGAFDGPSIEPDALDDVVYG